MHAFGCAMNNIIAIAIPSLELIRGAELVLEQLE